MRAASSHTARREAGPEWFAAFADEMSRLDQRLSQVEADVLNIYRSRIWRTLVRIGGFIDAVLGRRKPHQSKRSN